MPPFCEALCFGPTDDDREEEKDFYSVILNAAMTQFGHDQGGDGFYGIQKGHETLNIPPHNKFSAWLRISLAWHHLICPDKLPLGHLGTFILFFFF